MKRNIFLLLGFLISLRCLSQEHTFKNIGYVGVSLGASIPIGAFAGYSSFDPNKGYARLGTLFDISLSFNIDKNFSVYGMGFYQSNHFNKDAFPHALYFNYSKASWNVEKAYWSAGGGMLGVQSSFSISTKTSLETRILGGIAGAKSPQINATAIQGYSFYQGSASAFAFAYLLGGDLNLI